MLKSIAKILVLIVFLSSCSKQEPQVYNDRFFTFGTDVTISIYSADKDLVASGFKAIREKFKSLNQKLHPWNPGELQALNLAISKSEPHAVSPLLQTLILAGQEFNKSSAGLFDPAIGSLVKLWKFDNAANIHTEIPQEASLNIVLDQRPSISEISINERGEAICSNNLVRLDFGGFAKGFATEEAVKILSDLGINNAIVNAGGDLTTIGSKGGDPWSIGIRSPFADHAAAFVKTSSGTNVFTSGNYERFFEIDGKVYHHIIDPKTGFPSVEIASVTVIHESGMLADAAATALMVAGPKRWKDVARGMGVEKVMLITSDKKIIITPIMNSLVNILDSNLTQIIEEIN